MPNASNKALNTPVLIAGAGPAGLAIAAHLRKAEIPFLLIEKSQRIGNAWHEHYERLHLHTVKTLSHLPFLPFPEHYPQYVPRQLLVEYMEDYARHFDIQPLFGEALTNLQKQNNRWIATTGSGKTIQADYIVLATGVNALPYRPEFPGMDGFQGALLHSREYFNAQPFKGKNVLVIGMGNSGAEIALDLCENGARTWISVRGPVNIVPRDFWGRPTQLTALKLAKLPSWLGDRIGVLLRAITTGNLEPYGIKTPPIPPARQLRQTGQTPVVDIGAVRMIKQGRIKVLPAVKQFSARSVEFENGVRQDFDAVILATGYRPSIGLLLEDTEGLLDQHELPASCIGSGKFEGLYFLGFDNYTAGGILGVIRRDSEVIARHIRSCLRPEYAS